MEIRILRVLVASSLLSILSAILVWIISHLRGWETPTQFSDGFFWAGIVQIALGFISLQGYNQRDIHWLSAHLDPDGRAKLWAEDILRGRILAIVCGISGLLLIGVSILVLRLS